MVIIIWFTVALKYREGSVSYKLQTVSSQVKQDVEQVSDVDTTTLIDLVFLYLINQANKLLQTHKLELVDLCEN